LHRFRDIAFDSSRSKIAIFGKPSCVNPQTERYPFDDIHKIFRACYRMAKVPNDLEILWKISTMCTSVQTDRQATDRRTGDSIWRTRSLKILPQRLSSKFVIKSSLQHYQTLKVLLHYLVKYLTPFDQRGNGPLFEPPCAQSTYC